MVTVVLRTIIIYIVLHFTLRLLGKRQIGQLEISELVSTLLLSELATACITDTEIPFAFSFLPLLLLVALELFISDIKNRLPFLKRIFEGSPSVLISRGVLDQEEMKRMRISVEELLSAFRLQGVCTISEVYYAILEQNGQLSVILRKEHQQPTVSEMGLSVKESGIAHAVVVDGKVKAQELSASGQTRRWLKNVCLTHKVEIEEIFLLSVDDGGKVTLILRENKKNK